MFRLHCCSEWGPRSAIAIGRDEPIECGAQASQRVRAQCMHVCRGPVAENLTNGMHWLPSVRPWYFVLCASARRYLWLLWPSVCVVNWSVWFLFIIAHFIKCRSSCFVCSRIDNSNANACAVHADDMQPVRWHSYIYIQIYILCCLNACALMNVLNLGILR